MQVVHQTYVWCQQTLSLLPTHSHGVSFRSVRQVQGEQFLFALVLQAIRTRIEGGTGEGGKPGGKKAAWLAGFGDRRPSASCPGCDGAADPGCPMCGGTGVSLSELGFGEDDDKKAKTKSKKKRERKARAKAAKKNQDEDDEAATAADKAAADKAAKAAAKAASKDEDKHKQCNGHHGANGHAGEGTAGQQQQQPNNASNRNGGSGSGSGKPQQRPKTSAKAAAKAATAARQRAGSSGIESAGSLLSMLDDANGMPGGYGGEDDGEDGDTGIDEEIVREMERLKIQKAQTDVQRTRAALRSNLQKNFDQLLVSSTACKGGRGKA